MDKRTAFSLATLIAVAVAAFIISKVNEGRIVYRSETFHVSDTIMGMTVETDKKGFDKLRQITREEIERFDKIINPYNRESEIYALNFTLEHKTNVPLSPELSHALEKGLEYSQKSGGVFDISCRKLIKLWGFGSKEYRIPSSNEIEKALKKTGHEFVRLKGNTLSGRIKGQMFDLGSFGKGMILDRLKEIYLSKGVSNFLLNYGGDVLSQGLNPKGKRWRIGVRHPRKQDVMLVLESSDAFVVTSGDYERFFMSNGVRYHHILNAKTGRPARRVISATIAADKGLDADALSTIAFIQSTNFFTNHFNYAYAHLVIEEGGKLKHFSKTNAEKWEALQ